MGLFLYDRHINPKQGSMRSKNTIHSKRSRKAAIEAFLATLAEANLVDKFDIALWCGLVDDITVYSKDNMRFTFKNGQEIRA